VIAGEGERLRRRFRYQLRTLIVAVAGMSLAFAYGSAYYRLSRRGIREASAVGLPGFLYVPLQEAAASEDLTRHYRLATFYAPANWIDQHLFGDRLRKSPIICIMWRLSG
jgi:hypothetical protein